MNSRNTAYRSFFFRRLLCLCHGLTLLLVAVFFPCIIHGWEIRPATSSDVRFAQATLLRQAMNPFSIQQENMLVVSKNGDDNNMIGFGQIRPLDDTHAELASLFVQEDYRHQGIGGKLVEELLQRHRKKQEHSSIPQQKVCLLTLLPTVPFYEAHGFRLATKTEREAMPQALKFEFLAGSIVSAMLQNEIVCMIEKE
jgi:N-acetylglutamate synthase-like GNAT family acetyltransferase